MARAPFRCCVWRIGGQRVDNPGGRSPTWHAGRSDERVQPVLPRHARPRRRDAAVAARAAGHARLPARATTAWRSRRSTRPASCCSTTTPGWRSSRASTGRGTRTWTTSSPPVRRSACSTLIFRHVEGYDGPAGHRRAAGVRPRRAADRRRLRPQLRRHRQGDPQGATGQRRLPAGARRSAGGRGAAAPGAASRCSTRPPTSRASARARPCLTTSPGPGPWPTRSPTSPTSTPSRARSGPGTWCWSMNTLPFAQPSDGFSDGLVYRFRLRPLRRGAAGDASAVRTRTRPSSSSTASSPTPRAADGAAGRAPARRRRRAVVDFAVDDEGGGSADGVRVFAGLRWDPFILDAPAALKTIATGQLRVHRPRLDLPRRQERPRASSSSSTARACSVARRWSGSSPRR